MKHNYNKLQSIIDDINNLSVQIIIKKLKKYYMKDFIKTFLLLNEKKEIKL